MYNKKALSDAISKLNAAKAPKQEPDKVVNFGTKPFVSNQGYKQGPPPSNTHYRIPGDTIYNPTPYPLKAISSNGLEAFIPAYDTTNYTFPGADYIDEIEMPMARRGGNNRLPKRKTKSLSGVNKLMVKNPLFRSYGHKLFDSSHHSFQPGGQTLYVDPNDPAGRARYQAYQDSLKAYNAGKNLSSTWEKSDLDYFNKKYANNQGTIKREVLTQNSSLVYPTQYNNKGQRVNAWENKSNNINPSAIGRSTLYLNGKIVSHQGIEAIVEYPIYKKPEQPIQYKPDPEIVAKQQQLIDAGYNIGKVDGIWGKKSQAAWEEFQTKEDSPQENFVDEPITMSYRKPDLFTFPNQDLVIPNNNEKKLIKKYNAKTKKWVLSEVPADSLSARYYDEREAWRLKNKQLRRSSHLITDDERLMYEEDKKRKLQPYKNLVNTLSEMFSKQPASFQPGGETFVDSEPKNDFVYINRQIEVSPNTYITQQVAVPKNNTNLYKPVPLNTENLIIYLELKEKYPDIHEKVKSDWQKNPDRMPFEEYVKDAGWEQLTTTENIKQPYKGNKKWEELVESCPECLLKKGEHFERDDQGNIYLVQNPVKFPLDFWEKMYDENYNIEDFINIDTGVKEEDSVLKEVVSTPQEYKNLHYHQEWNPFTKRYEAMSPKQHMMLDREAYKLQNKGVQPTPDNMPIFQNRELLDASSRKPIGTRSWNTGSGWSWQEGDIIGNNSEKLPNTSGKRLMNKKRKKLITQPDNENNFIDTELSDEEIEEYKKGGYIVEELPQAQDGLMQSLLQRAKEQSEKPGFKTEQFAKEHLTPNVPKTMAEAQPIADQQMKQQRQIEAKQRKAMLDKAAENYMEYYNKTYGSDYGMLNREQALKKVSQPGFDVNKYAGMYNLGEDKNAQFTSNNQSTASRVWDVVTNPLTAFKYSVQTGDFRNMPSNLNAARMAGQDVDPDNLVGNALNMTTNLFDAGDKVIRNVGEGNYGAAGLEALRFLPGARVTTGLGTKAGNYLTTQTPLKNVYKQLPGSGNVDDVVSQFVENPNSYYRMIGETGYDDLIKQGYIRTNPNTRPAEWQVASRYEPNKAWFNKGAVLNTKYNEFGKPLNVGYKGPYMVEVSDIDMITEAGKRGRIYGYPKERLTLDNPNLKIWKEDGKGGFTQVFKQLPGSSNVDELVDLWRIQERGARPMSELAAEGKLGPMFQNEKAIQHFKDREKYFGQWFTKDKADFDFYKADREFIDPEVIQLQVPKSRLAEFQNYDKSLSRAPDREFVIPLEQQKLFTPKQLPSSGNVKPNSFSFVNKDGNLFSPYETSPLKGLKMSSSENVLSKQNFWNKSEIDTYIKQQQTQNKMWDDLYKEYERIDPTGKKTPNELNDLFPHLKEKFEAVKNYPSINLDEKFLTKDLKKYLSKNLNQYINNTGNTRNPLSRAHLLDVVGTLNQTDLRHLSLYPSSINVGNKTLRFPKQDFLIDTWEKGRLNQYGGMIAPPAGILGAGVMQDYQQGGYIEAELTDEEIKQLRRQGYNIEEL